MLSLLALYKICVMIVATGSVRPVITGAKNATNTDDSTHGVRFSSSDVKTVASPWYLAQNVYVVR